MLLPLFFCKSIFFLYVYYSSEYNRWYMKLPIYPFDNTFQGAYIKEEVIMLNKEVKDTFIANLIVVLQEEMLQLTLLISWLFYLKTGRELSISQSKLFLAIGTVVVIIIGLNSPVNYVIRIVSLIYRLKKQYEYIKESETTKREISENDVPKAIREQIKKQEAQM